MIRRKRHLHTLQISDVVKLGPLLLIRTLRPLKDPYNENHNPHVDQRPYFEGTRTYTGVLKLGQLRLEVRWPE